MKNRTPSQDRPPLPDFDPVPRKCNRHDGWTPTRQRAFVEALADTGSVTRAAASVNMSTESAYFLRRQPGAESFRRAWEAALDFGIVRLKDIALERAIEGDLVPVIAGGKIHGYRRVRNDRLLMFAIRMNDRAPDGRRQSATQFQPRRGDAPASTVTVETLTASEAQDAAAARIAAFIPVDLTPIQQAELYDSLAAEARRRADLLPAQDPDEPYLTPEDLSRAGLAPLGSPHADAAEEPTRAPHERPWYRLHDEAGAQAIDDAVASVEAAKLAGYFDDPDPARTGEGDRDATRRGGGGSEHAAMLMIEAALTLPDPLASIAEPLSPRTGKPLRPYKKRTPKPPFMGPE